MGNRRVARGLLHILKSYALLVLLNIRWIFNLMISYMLYHLYLEIALL